MPIILDDDLAATIHCCLCNCALLEDERGNYEQGDMYMGILSQYEVCYKRRISAQEAFALLNVKSRCAR